MKKYILFDHDGVLVDTEFWYYKAGERALADVGLALDKDQYLRDMNQGLGTWAQARAAGIDEQTISRITRIVMQTYEFEYNFRELSERCLNAPVTVFKALGDDYSFIEAQSDYSSAPSTVVELGRDHYAVLKEEGVSDLSSAIRVSLGRG